MSTSNDSDMYETEILLKPLIIEAAKKENYLIDKYVIKHLDNKGGNFLSKLYTITVSEDGKPDLELFCKATIETESSGTSSVLPHDIFYKEIFALRDLAEEFKRMYDQYRILDKDRFRFPKYYASRDEPGKEAIIMENFIPKSYEVYDRHKSMDWGYAYTAVAELAKYHAMSFVIREDNPDYFKTHIVSKEEMFTKKSEANDEQMKAYFKKLTIKIMATTKDRFKAKLGKWLQSFGAEQKDLFSPLRRGVLAHGDYRISNILIKSQKGALCSLIPIDYQTVYHGSPINDFLYLIITGTDRDFRQNYYQKLVDLFYEKLGEALRMFDKSVDKLYPIEDFREDLKERLEYGLFLAVMILPVVLIDKDEAPDMAAMKSVDDFTSFNFDSDFFIERFNGILEDYVDWGIL